MKCPESFVLHGSIKGCPSVVVGSAVSVGGENVPIVLKSSVKHFVVRCGIEMFFKSEGSLDRVFKLCVAVATYKLYWCR